MQTNLLSISELITKLSLLNDKLQNNQSISRLEHDLLKSYLLQLYDEVIILEVTNISQNVNLNSENRGEDTADISVIADLESRKEPESRKSDAIKEESKPHNVSYTSDIRTVIGLNKKFYFIKEIFSGNTVLYDKVINFINHAGDLTSTEHFIKEEVNNSSVNKDAYNEFMAIVKQRFIN